MCSYRSKLNNENILVTHPTVVYLLTEMKLVHLKTAFSSWTSGRTALKLSPTAKVG